ncbi:MAG: carbamoyltransferase HypF, partial [Gammaproteobacteria bacterium]
MEAIAAEMIVLSMKTEAPTGCEGKIRRLQVRLEGVVQGVGFRPFAHRLAHSLGLGGYVANVAGGLIVEVEGPSSAVSSFLVRLEADRPAAAVVRRCVTSDQPALGSTTFCIGPSEVRGTRRLSVPPDLRTCDDCLRELNDPSDRRYRYPFLNCTQCGPRFSILVGLPYDRRNTTMHAFNLCARCQAEFTDPDNRRFHAQATTCPDCGPQLVLRDALGCVIAHGDAALRAAVASVRRGEVLALKGLGGYQLITDARDAEAVQRLRERKHRPDKPFAIMLPNRHDALACCHVSPFELRLVDSPEAPIVLLRRRSTDDYHQPIVTEAVAPGNPWLGVMLPYTPLHHLLMGELGFPVVATSGNRGGEPMAIDEPDAFARLAGIAECFLTHDRPIARVVDDSVVRVIAGREMVLRCARGYAPLSVPATRIRTGPILGVGGHQKVAAATTAGNAIVIGPHVGDLDHEATRMSFRSRVAELCELERTSPRVVACDAHPDYYSTRHARTLGGEVVAVQHHVAHVLACVTEHGLSEPVLGVAWDGSGYGSGGSLWGGEFLLVDGCDVRRVAHLRAFRLPGGERAAVEPRRAALGLLYAAFGSRAFEMDLPPLSS